MSNEEAARILVRHHQADFGRKKHSESPELPRNTELLVTTREAGRPAMEEKMYSDSGKDQWFALQVRGRHERLVSTILTNKGYESFLPTYRNWEGPKRKRHEESPLFPGYVFCRFDAFRRLPILVTPGVIHVVGIGRQPVAIDEIEMHSLVRIVDENFQAELIDFLQPGEKVRIVEGPLSGVEGILIDHKNSLQLILSVTLLGRSVRVEVNRDCVVSAIPCFQPLARLLNKSQPRAWC